MGRFVTSPIQSQGIQFRNKQQFATAGAYTWSTPSGVGCVRVVTVGAGGPAIGRGLCFNIQGRDEASGLCHTNCCSLSLTSIQSICGCPFMQKNVCCISANTCCVAGKICGIFPLSRTGPSTCFCYVGCNLCWRTYCDGGGCNNLCLNFSNCAYNCIKACGVGGYADVFCKFNDMFTSKVTQSGGGGGGYADASFTVTPGASYAVCVGSSGCTSSFGTCISATGGATAAVAAGCLRLFIDGLFHPDIATGFACIRNANCCSCSYGTHSINWRPGDSSTGCSSSCTGVGCCCVTVCPTCKCFIVCVCAASNCDGYQGCAGYWAGCTIALLGGCYKATATGGCGIGGSINNCGGAPIVQTELEFLNCCMIITGCICCTMQVVNACGVCHDSYFYCINCICLQDICDNATRNCGFVYYAPGASAGNYYGAGITGQIDKDCQCSCCTCNCMTYCVLSGVVAFQISCCCRPTYICAYTNIAGGTGIGGLGGVGIGGSSIIGSASCPAATCCTGCFSGYNTVGDTIHFRNICSMGCGGASQLSINPRNPNSTQWFFPEDIKGFGARVFCDTGITYREDAGPGAGGLAAKSGVLAGASASSTASPGNGGGGALVSCACCSGGDGLVVIYY